MKTFCPHCHKASPLHFISKDYNKHITDENFYHYRCTDCELIFISPLPESLDAYYPDAYHSLPDSLAALQEASEQDRYKIEIVQRFAKNGSLLEIGPSYGGFAYLAKNAGFRVETIEMDAKCCDYLQKVVGVNVIHSSDSAEVICGSEAYDVVALWHVIEHLPNALEVLEAMTVNVRLAGYVVISSPNPDSFQFRVLGRRWLHLDAPRHVMLIPIAILISKMEQLGMKVEWMTTNDEGSVICNVGGWQFFFVNLSSNQFIKDILFRIGRLVAKLFSSIEHIEGKGSAYTIVFKKVKN
jgi:2-polyprenyl-3-methyl-5-hydroxy-6-metoxy-1,4-benzoquinol methylase